MSKTALRATGSLAAFALASLVSVSAFAQDAITAPQGAEDAAPAREIVVTGSLIRGTPDDSALPVEVTTAEELTANGVTNPLEFIKDLPASGAVLGDSNQFSTASQGFQGVGSINLRGLGAQRTLVLFNNRRYMPSPGTGFTNTNLIPLFALDRFASARCHPGGRGYLRDYDQLLSQAAVGGVGTTVVSPLDLTCQGAVRQGRHGKACRSHRL